jgi:hypothetical protein
VRSDEWATYYEVQVIKGQSGKSGKRAAKVIVLIWGDLFASRGSGNPHDDMRLSEQESAEAIVPVRSQVSAGKG